MRILVVDDELTVRQLLKSLLAIDGHAVETAADASEALSKEAANSFDLVLTDLKMPDMNGDALARLLKQRRPGLRIILLTGIPLEDLPPDCESVLRKPFSIADLRQAIARGDQG